MMIAMAPLQLEIFYDPMKKGCCSKSTLHQAQATPLFLTSRLSRNRKVPAPVHRAGTTDVNSGLNFPRSIFGGSTNLLMALQD